MDLIGQTVRRPTAIMLCHNATHHGQTIPIGARRSGPAQRIVLYAKDRGCTRPGCTIRGYWCEVHHVEDWATTHCTDVNKRTFACGADHPLVQPGSWTTRKRKNGETECIPPPHLDHGQPRTNPFHHPEKLLRDAAEYDTG